MVTKTQAIKAFLVANTHADLADMYNHDMECQITVAKDDGERIAGDFKGKQWHGYTDGIQTWKPIRIPRNANSEPEYEDTPMSYDLAAHAEGIGMTGWDWKARLSRWVAFDFDAITGHSEKHNKKLTDAELSNIRELLTNVPYVTIRKSTGGKGLHVYVFLKPTPTQNHNEHAAIARAILSQLSGIAGFDFSIRVDTCGGNMWVWHRKMVGTDGLTVIKIGEELADAPANWRDYTKVVSGRRQKNLPSFIEQQAEKNPEIEDIFSQMTSQRMHVPLDADHKRLMSWLNANYPGAGWWDADHHMLVSHTALLKEAHGALQFKGKFETLAIGEEKGADINCYLFPQLKGAWAVRRYTPGVQEHVYWKQDGANWTTCFFNKELSLEQACAIFNGVELSGTKGFAFANATEASSAAQLLGVDLGLPQWALPNPATLKIQSNGRLVASVEKGTGNPMLPTASQIPGWVLQGKKFERVFHVRATVSSEEIDTFKLDERVRHIVAEDGSDLGWLIRTDNEWHAEPVSHVKDFVRSLGYTTKEVPLLIGTNISHCWKVVNLPFKEEYPKNRLWNRNAAQLRFTPSIDTDDLSYPTWMLILNHLGQGLDDAVKDHPWCKSNNILTGADWLKCWIASLIKEPTEPLPYLFLYSLEQGSGKSMFQEMLNLLINRGVVAAANALTSTSAFNGEIETAVVCTVEELDLRKNMVAYNRIKDWVTNRTISLHKKGKQPYTIANTTHWVHTSNTHLACPVFAGDTRITMIRVPPIPEGKEIPRKIMMPLLEQEAPDFLAEILSIELPPPQDRLNIPCLTTEAKQAVQQANLSMLEVFLGENIQYAPGYFVYVSEFWNKFSEWLDPSLINNPWTKIKVGKEMPPQFVRGRIPATGQFAYGNMSFTKIDEKDFRPKYVLRGDKLAFEDNVVRAHVNTTKDMVDPSIAP